MPYTIELPDEFVEKAMTVGAIWRTSWGYDQTNVEFFEVVKRTPKTITLRRLKATVIDGRLFPLAGEYTTDFSLMGNAAPYGNGSRERDQERGYSEKLCRPRIGGGFISATISDCRTAWPYEGGGAYDTIAAGQPGH
jgi:hypothetical protein